MSTCVDVGVLIASQNRISSLLLCFSALQLTLTLGLVWTSVIETSLLDVAIALGIVVPFETVRRIAFTHLRIAYLRQYAGLSEEDTAQVDGSRLELEVAWVDEVQDRSRGRCRVRACDVLFRKGGHVTSLLALFMFHKYVVEEALLVALSAGSFLLVTTQLATLNAGPLYWSWLRYLYGASDRIRDGRLAKHNAIAASVALTLGVTTSYAIGRAAVTEADMELASELVVLPLTFGDALGEIVGTPLGQHTFRVSGLGEVNKKSVEGCLAVFLGSMIPSTAAAAAATCPASTPDWGPARCAGRPAGSPGRRAPGRSGSRCARWPGPPVGPGPGAGCCPCAIRRRPVPGCRSARWPGPAT